MYDPDVRFNLSEVLLDQTIARFGGDRPAFLFRDSRISYTQLRDQACRLGNFFLDLGVRAENRVLLALPDSPFLAAAFLGAIRMGAVPVLINPWCTREEFEHYLNDSRAVCALLTREAHASLPPAPEHPHRMREMVECDATGILSHYYQLQQMDQTLEPADTRYDDPAFWLYSSGTTGRPKGVVHLQHDLAYAAEQFGRRTLGMRETDLHYSTSKLFFAYGLGNSLGIPLATGGAAVLDAEKSASDRVVELLRRHQPTVFYSVPSLYALLLNALPAGASAEMDSVRLCLSAGENLPAEIFQRWKTRFGKEILDGIGTTEMTHIFIANRPGQARAGSSGQAVDGYEIGIVDGAGQEVPAGEQGSLMVRGDSAALGYWRNHEKSKQTFRGDWVATGDRFWKDAEGYYWFVGRSDDLFKAAGQWVSPVEIEAVLMESPLVLEAAVISYQDAEGLTRPKAFVVLQSGAPPASDAEPRLRELLQQRLPRFKNPGAYAFIDAIPKTQTGKKQRYKLR